MGALINQQAGYHNCITSFILRSLAFFFGRNGHWVALRKENNNQFVDLNSQLQAPNIYNGDHEMNDFLLRHLRSGSHILIATLKTEQDSN